VFVDRAGATLPKGTTPPKLATQLEGRGDRNHAGLYPQPEHVSLFILILYLMYN
jgi:hypothetical protein